MKKIQTFLAGATLIYVLSAGTALAQYNYSPAPAAVPTPSVPTAAPAVNAPTTNFSTSPAPGTTASDPGSVNVPAIPNTGAGGEAPENIALLAASLLVALTGLVFLRKKKTV